MDTRGQYDRKNRKRAQRTPAYREAQARHKELVESLTSVITRRNAYIADLERAIDAQGSQLKDGRLVPKVGG